MEYTKSNDFSFRPILNCDKAFASENTKRETSSKCAPTFLTCSRIKQNIPVGTIIAPSKFYTKKKLTCVPSFVECRYDKSYWYGTGTVLELESTKSQTTLLAYPPSWRNDLISRTHDLYARTYDLTSRTHDLLSHTYEITFSLVAAISFLTEFVRNFQHWQKGLQSWIVIQKAKLLCFVIICTLVKSVSCSINIYAKGAIAYNVVLYHIFTCHNYMRWNIFISMFGDRPVAHKNKRR